MDFACPQCHTPLQATATQECTVIVCARCSHVVRVPHDGGAYTLTVAETEAEPAQAADPLAAGVDEATTVDHITVTQLPAEGTAVSDASGEFAPGAMFGDYQILAEIARGGMGVVYKARHVKLNRVVALKMILSGRLAREDQIRRFHAEAEAAAQLDHPGIVPIYEVGELAGRHFFSMGFVDGTSLVAALSDGPLEPREAARLVLEVARAVAYAHERGVIHRDLKPANILLDAGRQPRVTDFGLAKQVEADSELTQAGAVLGTPSYMPPEQAAGRMDQVGPLADVYSLGATLYCLLTARPPFHAAHMADTLRQVIEQEPVSPSQLNAAVDRDLETICLKCLQKEPSRRYGSASDLADDLVRYLEGQPIHARPISSLGRLTRWCRRNPRVALLAGAFLFALAAGTVISTFFAIQSAGNAKRFGEESVRANAETTRAVAALARESEALEQFKTQLRATEDAIDKYVETVGNATLLKDARFQPLMKELLKDALAHYQRYIRQYGDATDPKTLERLADAFFRIGWINDESGSKAEALTAYRQALAIRERLAADHPSSQYHQSSLAKSHANLATLYIETGKLQESLASYQLALRLLRQLAQQHPSVAAHQILVGSILSNMGNLYRETGRLKEANAAYQEALEIRQRIAGPQPSKDALRDLGVSHNQIGVLYYETGDLSEALAAYRRALEIRQRLVKVDADVLYRRELAGSHNNIGLLLQDLDKPTEALAAFQQSLSMRRDIAFEHPTVDLYQGELANIHFNIGRLYRRTGRPAEALTAFQQALAIQERLTKANSNVMDFQLELARSCYSIGLVYRASGKTNEALGFFQRGRAIQEDLAKKHPSVIEIRSSLAMSHYSMGRLYRSTRQFREAEAAFQRALAIQQRLAREQPSVIDYQRNLANSYNSIGIVYDSLKRTDKARDAYLKALAIHERLAREDPTNAEHQVHVAGAHVNLSQIAETKDPAAALKRLDTAVELLEAVLQRNPKDSMARRFGRNAHATRAGIHDRRGAYDQAAAEWQRAFAYEDGDRKVLYGTAVCRSLARAGEHKESATWAEKLAGKTRYADDLAEFARGYAISIAALKKDQDLSAEDRQKLSDLYARKAMILLTQAAKAGYFAQPQPRRDLETSRDFDALRDRQEFRDLLERLGKPPAGQKP